MLQNVSQEQSENIIEQAVEALENKEEEVVEESKTEGQADKEKMFYHHLNENNLQKRFAFLNLMYAKSILSKKFFISLHNNRDTEYSSFIPHSGFHRPQLARRSTSLRMEGEMDVKTEKNESYQNYKNYSKVDPIRKPTNLKMEGSIDCSTESHEKYTPFVGAKRPELLRRPTHLRLEGEPIFTREYSDVFKEYGIYGKIKQKKFFWFLIEEPLF